jgi:hypothetical protein
MDLSWITGNFQIISLSLPQCSVIFHLSFPSSFDWPSANPFFFYLPLFVSLFRNIFGQSPIARWTFLPAFSATRSAPLYLGRNGLGSYCSIIRSISTPNIEDWPRQLFPPFFGKSTALLTSGQGFWTQLAQRGEDPRPESLDPIREDTSGIQAAIHGFTRETPTGSALIRSEARLFNSLFGSSNKDPRLLTHCTNGIIEMNMFTSYAHVEAGMLSHESRDCKDNSICSSRAGNRKQSLERSDHDI